MYFNGYLVKLMVAHLHHDAISNKKEPTVVTTARYFVSYAEWKEPVLEGCALWLHLSQS